MLKDASLPWDQSWSYVAGSCWLGQHLEAALLEYTFEVSLNRPQSLLKALIHQLTWRWCKLYCQLFLSSTSRASRPALPGTIHFAAKIEFWRQRPARGIVMLGIRVLSHCAHCPGWNWNKIALFSRIHRRYCIMLVQLVFWIVSTFQLLHLYSWFYFPVDL